MTPWIFGKSGMLMFLLLDHAVHRALTSPVRIWPVGVNAGLAGVRRPDPPRVRTPGLGSDRVLIRQLNPAWRRPVYRPAALIKY